METKNKFEDLVLDNDSKKNKQKKIVFRIILFVVVLLIVLIIMKVFSKSSPDMKSPEPVANFKQETQLKDTEVFENIASKDEGFSDDFKSLEDRLRMKNNTISKNDAVFQDNKSTKQNTTNTTNTVAQAPKPKVETKKPSSLFDDLNTVKPNESAKTNTTKANSAVAKPVATSPKPSTNASGNNYIQIYAGTNIDMKSHEIKKLDAAGLNYQLVTDSKGMGRVIVGPYTDAEKQKALENIRATIKKDAFFYKAK